jgi:glucose-6-phosphate isomerase
MANVGPIHAPIALSVAADGTLTGRSSTYRKRLADLDGLYLDDEAFQGLRARLPDMVAYWVEESRADTGQGGLVIGTSTLEPGKVGSEYWMTRGHLHALADRAELYYCVSGRGVMLMETVDGRVSTVELTAGKAVHIPGYWVHRSVNVGTERFSTLFCYPVDAGQDYEIIRRAGGMATLIVDDGHGGWTTRSNPRHRGYSGPQSSGAPQESQSSGAEEEGPAAQSPAVP